MDVALYARVSTKDKGQDNENQLLQLRSYCQRQGWNIVGEYVDQASGGTSERAQFKRMFADARKRTFDVLLFWSLDRLSREGVGETLNHLQRLTSNGVAWKSFTEEYLDSCGDAELNSIRPVLVHEFVNQVFLPFQRGKWKDSTKGTSENRIQFHIVKELGNTQLESFTPTKLQAFLDTKAATSGFSVVDHLRWDLSSIFQLAVAEKVIAMNPTTSLYTPKSAKSGVTPVMTIDEVGRAVDAVDFRERVILHLAVFAGLRPGEMLALQRRHVAQDRGSVQVEQRVYRGDIDDPKNGESRSVAIPQRTAAFLGEWMDTAVDPSPDAWVFASESGTTPLWRDNLLRRHIRPALNNVGLGWVDFKVMRRTNASLGQDAKVDPKVSADQRGHGIGVSLDVYTKTSIGKKSEGAQKLEDAVLGRKVVAIREKMAS